MSIPLIIQIVGNATFIALWAISSTGAGWEGTPFWVSTVIAAILLIYFNKKMFE